MGFKRRAEQFAAGLAMMGATAGVVEAKPHAEVSQNKPAIETESSSLQEQIVQDILSDPGTQVSEANKADFQARVRRLVEKLSKDPDIINVFDTPAFKRELLAQIQEAAKKFRVQETTSFVEKELRYNRHVTLPEKVNIALATQEGECYVGKGFLAVKLKRNKDGVATGLSRSSAGATLRAQVARRGLETNNQIKIMEENGELFGVMAVEN